MLVHERGEDASILGGTARTGVPVLASTTEHQQEEGDTALPESLSGERGWKHHVIRVGDRDGDTFHEPVHVEVVHVSTLQCLLEREDAMCTVAAELLRGSVLPDKQVHKVLGQEVVGGQAGGQDSEQVRHGRQSHRDFLGQLGQG